MYSVGPLARDYCSHSNNSSTSVDTFLMRSSDENVARSDVRICLTAFDWSALGLSFLSFAAYN